MQELRDWGLADYASSIDLVLTRNKSRPAADKEYLENARALCQDIIPKASVSVFAENTFEYRGIQKAWDLAKSIPEVDRLHHVVLYFHSKGMVFKYDNDTETRTRLNLRLTNTIIKPWKLVVRRFAFDPKMNRAGYAVSGRGWIWFNFWYARASYLSRLVKPILKRDDRFYFEQHLAKIDINSTTIYFGEPVFEDASIEDALSMCYGFNPNMTLGKWVSHSMVPLFYKREDCELPEVVLR